MTEPEIGVAVISRAGRDKGRAFLIVGRADEAHALLCDGETRRLAAPKKKKLRHLRVQPQRAEALAKALANGTATDADIRKALRELGYNTEFGKQEE